MNVLELLEEFKDYVKGEPVFYATKKKPFSSKEMKEILGWKNLRFIVVANKEIYIFPVGLLHFYVAEHLNINYHNYWENKYPIFYGEAGIVRGKIVFKDSYDFTLIKVAVEHGNDEEREHARFQIKRLAELDWVLAQKYIVGFDKILKTVRHINGIHNKE
jgi:hypothetical protein